MAFAATVGWETPPEEALEICVQEQERLKHRVTVTGPRDFALFPGITADARAVDIAAWQALSMSARYVDAVAAYRALLGRTATASPVTQMVVWGTLGGSLAMVGELDEAARVSRPNRSLNFLHACDIAAVICHSEPSYVESADPPLVIRPLASADQFRYAAAARREARLGRHLNALLRLRSTTTHELTVAHWTEVMMAARGRAAAAAWLKNLPDPQSASGSILRQLCAATVVTSAARAADLAEGAAELASIKGLHGLFAEAPEQLWRRPSVAKNSSPVILAAVCRLKSDSMAEDIRLTEREHEVLTLLPLNLRLADLAERLFVSIHTLKWHRANLYRKLEVNSRSEAVRRGSELGLM